ncbi:glycerophosphodiester phosphodiesterase family protein [Telmatocola sphagniphila]|uniref:Glycerophosphodiester phosphodiesterase family protein n=1 Tax=Telmatocola sphagniphila TaxID=1123043 RepID=A0A8E6B9Y1_9BACT|nr:glycerophosphodiester phosphodiesterase family protein [Telmatocola sphagniphila]QVL34513.1 glycerophosphodiester phosphodiesterase family protein [Telmatocola sphagniphila]
MRSSFIAWIVLQVAQSSLLADEPFRFFEPVQPPRKMQIVAHLGMHQLAPENSPAALLACSSDYIEWAQVPIRLTRDGKHVILSDETVDRITSGHGKVSELTLAELKKLDTGSAYSERFKDTPIPTLAEVLKLSKGKLNLVLQCERVDSKLLVKEILGAQMQNQVLVQAEPDVLKKISQVADQKLAKMLSFNPDQDKLENWISEFQPDAALVEADRLTNALCKTLQTRGIKLFVQATGSPDSFEVWNKLIHFPIDAIVTDNPVGVRFAEVRNRIPNFPVKISYHRGACRYAPENTLASIQMAAALGADYIEVDIRPTSDGKYMLLHDSTLNRTTNGKGPIRKSSFDEVRALTAGAWFSKAYADQKVPTLSEGLTAMGKQSHGYLDSKDITPEDLLAAMQKHDLMERSVVYQSAQFLEKLKKLHPKVRALPPLDKVEYFDKVAAISPYGFDTEWKILSKELIEKAHNTGIKIFSDSLAPLHENVEEYLKAMNWGIDVIQTNYPLRVLRAIELFTPSAKSTNSN